MKRLTDPGFDVIDLLILELKGPVDKTTDDLNMLRGGAEFPELWEFRTSGAVKAHLLPIPDERKAEVVEALLTCLRAFPDLDVFNDDSHSTEKALAVAFAKHGALDQAWDVLRTFDNQKETFKNFLEAVAAIEGVVLPDDLKEEAGEE